MIYYQSGEQNQDEDALDLGPAERLEGGSSIGHGAEQDKRVAAEDGVCDDAVERLVDGVVEVVDGGDGVALLQQLQHRVRADEPRAARHQHAPAGPGRSPNGEIHEHLDVEEGMRWSAWIW